MLGDMTQEERVKLLVKAKEARQLKKEQGEKYAKENLKLEYADSPHWKRLSSDAGWRMPPWWEAYNAKRIRKLLKCIGRDGAWLTNHWGVNINKVGNLNPTYTCYAICGLILEDHYSDKEKGE